MTIDSRGSALISSHAIEIRNSLSTNCLTETQIKHKMGEHKMLWEHEPAISNSSEISDVMIN